MRSHPHGYGNGPFFAICCAPLSDLYYVVDDKRGYPARGHEVFVDDSGKKIAIAIGNPRAESPWAVLGALRISPMRGGDLDAVVARLDRRAQAE